MVNSPATDRMRQIARLISIKGVYGSLTVMPQARRKQQEDMLSL